jgi:hypothetical protein
MKQTKGSKNSLGGGMALPKNSYVAIHQVNKLFQ